VSDLVIECESKKIFLLKNWFPPGTVYLILGTEFQTMRKLSCWLLIVLPFFSFSQAEQRFQFVHQQMGTTFQIIFYSNDSTFAQLAADSAFAKLDELNQCLSDYLGDSELNQLVATSGTGKWVKVSEDLWDVLVLSQQYASVSDGAFDITVGAVSKLWRRAIRRKSFPDNKRLHLAKAKIGYEKIKLDEKEQQVLLMEKGMRLDLGGIAKGYTVDQMVAVLESFGIERILVDGGGDIRVTQAPPSAIGWTIMKRTLDKQGELQNEVVYLQESAIATSGDQYKYLDWEGKRYSHLIDPREGIGVTHRRLVTIIANNCATADALASVFSLIEEDEIFSLSNEFKDIELQILRPHEDQWTQLR